MTENINFKPLRERIDNILSQLSGLSTPTMPRLGLLESLFKEFRHELSPNEEKEILTLFSNASKKENKIQNVIGTTYRRKITYDISPEIMNEIEILLRKLLDKYSHYQITRENKDYQIGEF